MNKTQAEEIIATHKRGACEECFEGDCMDEAYGYLHGCMDTLAQVEPLIQMLEEISLLSEFRTDFPCREIHHKAKRVLRQYDALQRGEKA